MSSFNLVAFQEKVKNTLFPYGINLEDLIKDHSLDENKLKLYIEDFDIEDRDAMLHIVNNIKYVSWFEFKKKLLNLANNILEKIGSDSYGFILHSSSEKHSEFYFTCFVYEYVFKNKNEPLFYTFEKKSTNLIYIDDCSYSGIQLYGFINSITENIFSFFTLNPGPDDIPIYIINNTIDDYKVDYSNQNYFIVFYKTNDTITLFTKDKKYVYNRFDCLKLIYDLQQHKINYPESEFIIFKKFKVNYYINKNELLYSGKKFKIYLCIPYISEIAMNNILLKTQDFKNIEIIFPEIINYRIYNIIESASPDIKNKVIDLFKLYYHILPKPDLVFPVYFDHKIASNVSTLACILGCGIVLSLKSLKYSYKGPIIKNCSINETEKNNISEYLLDVYIKKEPFKKIYNNACSFCPKPIYKLSKDEIDSYIKK
jgi:hypothetical protein